MHTVQILLKTTKSDRHEIDRRFHALSHLHNVCVKHARKLLIRLQHDPAYTELKAGYTALLKKDKPGPDDTVLRKGLSDRMAERRQELGLTKSGLEGYLKICGRRFSKLLSSQQVQKEADRVWRGVEKCLFENGKMLHFKRYIDFDTVSGKSNTNGACFDPGRLTVSWLGLEMECRLPKRRSDREYVLASIKGDISYCTIKRLMFSGGWRYYAEVTVKGSAPEKYLPIGDAVMGIDPGVSTMAGVSDDVCVLEELAPDTVRYEKELLKLSRSMDVSRRISNPNKYKADGTFNRADRSPWKLSKNYFRMRRKLKSLYRKKNRYTVTSHRTLCNRLLTHAKHFLVEKMDYKGLQKRSEKTERQTAESEIKTKSGEVRKVRKFKRKKRFGRSINRRAPARFLQELKTKAMAAGGSYAEVDTKNFKASQYNHAEDTYEKIPLSQREKQIGGRIVQRDLYSAFLIRNADVKSKHPDRDKCKRNFGCFADMQDRLIADMRMNGLSMRQCFGF